MALLREGHVGATATMTMPRTVHHACSWTPIRRSRRSSSSARVHIGVALAQLAKAVGGFRVVVVDARGAWATRERFPPADEIHVMHADDYLKGHPLASNAYVAVLSHDPEARRSGAVRRAAERCALRRRDRQPQDAARTAERLKAAGLTDEQMDRLYGPIGLDIGAQSPEEIGVSILAQIIAAKNGSCRRPRASGLSGRA